MDKKIIKKGLIVGLIALFFIAIIGVVVYVLLSPPQFYIQQLHIRKDNSTTSIVMDLKFVSDRYIFYDDINITLYYYVSTKRFSIVGYYVIPGFHLVRKIAVHREVVVEAHGPSSDDMLRKISNGSTVKFRVELSTKYWMHARRARRSGTVVAAAADLHMDGSG